MGTFPQTFNALRRMVPAILLETSMSRAIARKGLQLLGIETSGEGPGMLGQFAHISAGEDGPSPLGFEFDYLPEAEFYFPDRNPSSGLVYPTNAARYTDTSGLVEGRLLVWTTSIGLEGSTIFVEVEGGGSDRGWMGARPSAPLDAVGLHLSEWTFLDLPVASDPPDSARLNWLISNPSEAEGVGSVGLMQLQTRHL